MKVANAMHFGIHCVSPDASVSEVAEVMRQEGIGAVPVVDAGHLLGMITDRDLALRVFSRNANPAEVRARDVMTRDVISCRQDQSIEDAIRLMAEYLVRRLPVIDSNKRMVGMLSLGDIAFHSGSKLSGELLCCLSRFRTRARPRVGQGDHFPLRSHRG